MSLAWTLRRLRSMEPGEIVYRMRQWTQSSVERLGIGLAPRAVVVAADTIPPSPQVEVHLDPALYCRHADEILSGRFRIFALQPAQLGFPPRWNRDPKTGVVAPLSFGKTLNYRDDRLVGNIKYLWEPNRHLELVTLAQAWHLSRDDRYAEGCRTLLESWFEQCPYPKGPTWTSSLELGIRLVNWAYAWRLLGGTSCSLFSDDEGEAFMQRWLTSICQHSHFIAGHLSRYSSANNHLLGELLGLFVASTTWPLWRESAGWREQARAEFEREALLQNGADGVNREQGIWYHHEVADMMLIAGLSGRAHGVEFGEDFWRRLEAMLEFIASMMDVGGNVPAIGDSDDAVIIRYCPDDQFNVYRSLLATGAVLFNRGDFRAKAIEFDDKSRWLLGDAGADRFNSIRPAVLSAPVKTSFPEGGYYILGSEFETVREVRIVADAGPLGYLSIAAHGHADALSLTVSASGQPILIDPGTYAYHTEQQWRDYFRGTRAHNTICVDGQEQSVSGGKFLWTEHASCRCEEFESTSATDCFVASHDGYLRLSDPVHHRRRLAYDKRMQTLDVVDSIRCRGQHRVEIMWHYHPDCVVSVAGDKAVARRGIAQLTLSWPAMLTGELYFGSEVPLMGWASPRFDSKYPCFTLVVAGTISGAWEGCTRLEISPS